MEGSGTMLIDPVVAPVLGIPFVVVLANMELGGPPPRGESYRTTKSSVELLTVVVPVMDPPTDT